MKEMTLTDSTTSKTWNHEYISSPFSENSNFGETDVTVLSGNVYTDYVYRKRVWTNIFGHLTTDEFAELWGFIQGNIRLIDIRCLHYLTAQLLMSQ